jgi:predicted porin
MKRVALLGSTALFGAGMMANTAMAADGIKLGLGGFFRSTYMATFDDDGEGEPGNDRNTDGVFSNAEIFFTGDTTLDNGLIVGARVELEGENANDQIDEAYVHFDGGFGQVRVGSDDEALGGACILPPGGTDNFSAFSPDNWGANTDPITDAFPALTSNAACVGVDDHEDAQKIVYYSPNFGGFQLALSYTPNEGAEGQNEDGGPHIGMPDNLDGESRHNASVYGTYSYAGDGWGMDAGIGGSFEGQVESSPGPDRDKQQFYQGALNFTFGNFAVGGVFEYYNNLFTLDTGDDIDAWVAGGGVAYTMDAWTFGAQYSHQLSDVKGSDDDFTMDRAVATAVYALGPGINVDGEVGYTWTDVDGDLPGGLDDNYDAWEIGIGTALTF